MYHTRVWTPDGYATPLAPGQPPGSGNYAVAAELAVSAYDCLAGEIK